VCVYVYVCVCVCVFVYVCVCVCVYVVVCVYVYVCVVGHGVTEAFTFVWTSHLVERRPGYAAQQVYV
jgi:hypothetical protein